MYRSLIGILIVGGFSSTAWAQLPNSPQIGTPPNKQNLPQPYTAPARQQFPPPVRDNPPVNTPVQTSFNPSGGWSMGPFGQANFPVRRGDRVKIVVTDNTLRMSDTRRMTATFTKAEGVKNEYIYQGTANAQGETSDPANPAVKMVQADEDNIEIRYPQGTVFLKRTSPPETIVKAKEDVERILNESRKSGGLANAKFHNELAGSADAHCRFLLSVKFEETGNPLDAHWQGATRFGELEAKLKAKGYQLDDEYRNSETVFVIQKDSTAALEDIINKMRSSTQHWNNLMTPNNTVYIIGAAEAENRLYVTICVIPVK